MSGVATGALTGALLAAVWQGVLLAALVGLGLRLLPKTPAAVRFAVWFAVFLMVAALPVISLWPRAQGSFTPSQGAWLTLDPRWSLAIAAVWLAASVVRAVTLGVAAIRVRALWKRAVPVAVEDSTHFDGTAMNGTPRFGAGRRVAQLCVSDEVDRPTVIGFFAPKILIPRWLLEKLTAAELEQVVLHESGHLGRADDWMNLLQKIALVLFPLNPALAWVERRLCFERELAVDERVLQAFAGKAGAAKAYASCLATLAEYRLGRRGIALAIGLLGRESELGQRVGRILRRGELMRPMQARLVMGGAMLGLLGASAGLERCPQVIGFAPVTSSQMASLDAIHEGALLPPGYRVQSVVFHPKTGSGSSLNGRQNVTHEPKRIILPDARFDGGTGKVRLGDEQSSSTATVLTGTPEQERDSAAPVAHAQMHTVSAVTRAATVPSEVGVRWVVVTTAWQSADGSRTVMTTERTQVSGEVSPRRVSREDAEQASEQVHPQYAVLPVRDGWLAFQL